MRIVALAPLVLICSWGCSTGTGSATSRPGLGSATEGETVGDATDTSGIATGADATTGGSETGGSETGGSDTSSDTSGSETGPATCMRRRYTLNLVNQSWSSVPVDEDWTGPNAPSCDTPVLAAEYIDAWSMLYVLAEDGLVHRRVGAAWQPPIAVSRVFPELEGETIMAAVYEPIVDEPGVVTFYLNTDVGTEYAYELDERGTATLLGIHEYTDPEPPAAPLGSEDPRWAITFPDSFPDDVTWGYFVTDGNYYEIAYEYATMSAEWSQWPGLDGPYFSGAENEPDPNLIEAAYADLGLDRLHFIGP